jgi:adenylyl- and sulfurtransferase ThiI
MGARRKKEAILLFSGGKDSFLAACQLIENGFKIHMVTFENGMGLAGHHAEHGARRIVKRYGVKKAEFLGVHPVAGIWRAFFLPYFNMPPSEIAKEYGELTISQFHCLTCRAAMYIWSVIKARQMKIGYIADGARKDQGFVIELPCMIDRFRAFLGE